MTAEGSVSRRATRRNLTTQPIPRKSTTRAREPHFEPLSPDELAYIIAEARTERTEADIAEYARRKAS